MAENKEQGTGKHPHKSAEEPYSHNEAPTTSGESKKSSGKESGGSHSGSHETKSHSSKSESGSESDDLKSREYTDAQGNVHHHTHTAGKK